MKGSSQVRALLVKKFEAKYIDATLKHFLAAREKHILREWDAVALKAGKFVESITKTLLVFCGKSIPKPRDFKAGNELRQLEKLPAGTYPDVVRIVIPKVCIFVYEVVNNRGGRHDADDIDANEMDANVILPNISWVLAELVRFSSKGGDTIIAMNLIEELTNKTYPYFEVIDGRFYINIKGLKAIDTGLLLLYSLYPKRIGRQGLVDLVVRHGHKRNTANVAVHRLKRLVDDDNGKWKLRSIGRQEAEGILRTVS